MTSINTIKKVVQVCLLLLTLFVFSSMAFAGNDTPPPNPGGNVDGVAPPNPGGNVDGVAPPNPGGNVDGPGYGSATIENFLQSDDIRELIFKIIDIILIILLPIIILYIMYAGFLFVMAAGNPGKVSEARTALMNAIIGGVIIFAARALIDIIEATITSL